MRYLSAYLLSQLGGTDQPSVLDLKEIITAADVEFDENSAKVIVEKLKGKDVHKVIEIGKAKLGSMFVSSATVVPAAEAASTVKQAVKEEKKAIVKEESSDEDMGIDIFG